MAGTWSDGDAYERFMGRWGTLLAAQLVDWLQPAAGSRWVDVGSGTGAVTAALLAAAAPAAVTAVDPTPAFTAYARQRLADDRVEVRTGNAEDLPVDSRSADYAVASLVLNFVADPGQAVQEMARVVRPGGTVAACVWDYAQGMEMLRLFWDAAVALDPAAAALDEARFPVCRPGALARLFAEAGLTEVQSGQLIVPTVFADADDFWDPFLGGQGAVAGYIASLSGAGRQALCDEVRGHLPVDEEGRVRLTARAWCARGLT